MDPKFSQLRFGEFAKSAAAVAVSGVVALHPVAASAATGSIQVYAGNAIWFLNTNITFSTTSSDWGFSEASLHTASGTRHDAYDGALSWHVQLAPIGGTLAANAYKSPGGVVDILPSPASLGDPTVAKTVDGNPQTLAGLTVTGQVYFPVDKAVVRNILFMQNPTGADITVNVLSASNLGSDNNTVIQETSSGDNPFNFATDHWVVSSETADPTIENDPVLTFALSEAGAPAQATAVFPIQTGSDRFYWSYNNVTVPAGQTRALMIFSQLSDTVAHAEADAPRFNNNATLAGTDYLAGLTAAQRGEIVNWNISGTVAHDFNGDGHSDILWRNTSGNMAIWEMNGGTILNPSNSGLGSVPTTFAIVGQRDFNGDGNADIVWRDTSGNLAIWEMNGTTILNPSNSGLGSVPTTWSIVGTGDFNGDGYADILWRNTSTGDLAIWEMNGTTILNPSNSGLGSVPLNWSVVGTGDFNGDGKADILWRNANNGNVAIWEMNGTTILNANTATFGNMPAGWFVAGTGDFNGDGNSDILWRDSSGDIAIWEMNGTTILNPNTTGVGNLSTAWSVAETGDFDGDGKSDILWLDTDGNVAMWFMNGTAISSGVGLGNMGSQVGTQQVPAWHVQSLNAE